MTATSLLDELRQNGARFTLAGDRLRVDAPVGLLTEHVRAELRRLKPELMALLRRAQAGRGAAAPTSPRFRFVDGKMVLGDICAGWTPAAWCKELRRKALRCEELHPETARYYREWADDIERRGGGNAAA